LPSHERLIFVKITGEGIKGITESQSIRAQIVSQSQCSRGSFTNYNSRTRATRPTTSTTHYRLFRTARFDWNQVNLKSYLIFYTDSYVKSRFVYLFATNLMRKYYELNQIFYIYCKNSNKYSCKSLFGSTYSFKSYLPKTIAKYFTTL